MSGFIISGYKPLYTHLFNRDLTFTFENYVKCQIHLPIIPDIYGRDIYDYVKALKCIKGSSQYREECGKVLIYFYKDMMEMLCSLLKRNPDIKVNINIAVETKSLGFPVAHVSLSSVAKDLSNLLEYGDLSESVIGAGIFTKFTYQEMDKLVPNKALALASILYQYSNGQEATILEVVDNEDQI
jgi:hypothetical protein